MRLIGTPPLLASLRQRIELIRHAGIDIVCVLDFNAAYARRSAADFIEKTLVGIIGVHTVVIGSDFRFGRSQRGDLALLTALGTKFGYAVEGVPPVIKSSLPVSSTRIRALIQRADLAGARSLLGREVSINGIVVRGSRRGRRIGVPTANIRPYHDAVPPSGVYAVYVIIDGKRYRAALSIGTRPTFRNSGKSGADARPVIEAHIFGFNRKIYGKEVEVIVVKRLREQTRFSDTAKLLQQIRIDERNARMVL